MKKRDRRILRKAKGDLVLNLAPFIDILFCLLIVFMIAAPVIFGGVSVDLPFGNADVVIVKQEPLSISIRKDGGIYLDDNPIKLELLAPKMLEMTGSRTDVKVYVRADRDLNYGRVIGVVSTVYESGFSDVSLLTDITNSP